MTTRLAVRRTIFAAALLLAATSCTSGTDRPASRRKGADSARDSVHTGAERIAFIEGLHDPESVRYDPEADVYYVTNMEMYGSVKDNNGYITRIDAANVRKVEIIARGGEKGVTLHAPKGIAIHGDTLWVADIDVLRAFHRHSGASLGEIDFAAHRPTMLNDVALGPDGRIRVTDTGIVMSEKGVVFDTTGDRVFIVGPGRAVETIPAGDPYPKPNGITWDARGKRWLTVTFGQFESRLYELKDTSRTVIAEGKGKWDGVEALDDGRILFSSWSDSSIHVVERGRDRQLITGVATAADIGIDTRRKRIAIPLAGAGRVDIWTIPDAQ